MFRLFGFLLISILCFCTFDVASAQTSDIPKTITEQALDFNDGLLIDILRRDTELVLSKALPEFQELEGAKSGLEKLMSYLPDYKEGMSFSPFFTDVRVTTDSTTSQAIYHTRYEFTDLNNNAEFTHEWAIVDLYSQETSDGLKLRHFNFKTHAYKPSEVGNFGVKNKSLKHYVFLGLLIIMPIFIIFTIIAIIRNKHLKKKWLWGLFSSVGLWGVNFNWLTGKITPEFISLTSNADGTTGWHMKLISVKVLGASFLKASQYSPYIITIAFPIGAILYWTLKHKDKTVPKAFE